MFLARKKIPEDVLPDLTPCHSERIFLLLGH